MIETNQPPEKKSNNKVLIIIGVVVLLCCCAAIVGVIAYRTLASTVQSVNDQILEGLGYSGIADELLKSDVITAIAGYEESQTGCTDVSLIGGQVFLSPEQSGDGSWVETWQVSACGESHLYSVTFTPAPEGGTNFEVRPLEQ